MSVEHNFMAHEVSSTLLRQLRSGEATAWATPRLSTKSTLWQGIADWPRPDIAFEDSTNNSSFAIEFKPPNQVKREYVTGLGQAITYLSDFEFSGLVVPKRTADGFEISKYLNNILDQELATLSLALFEYDQDINNLTVLRPLTPREPPPSQVPKGIGRKVFWGYWRDLSNYDLFELLRLSDEMDGQGFDKIFQRFWTGFATKGTALTWEGKTRKAKMPDAKSFGAERLNAQLAMRHSGLLSADGQLTASGHDLLRIGKIYSPDSVAFLEMLTYYILTDGHHLNLIFWIDEQNRAIDVCDKNDRSRYFAALDKALVEIGVIAPRKHHAKTHFIRDEPKLWNKLGLLVRDGNRRYFHKGHGLLFDWRKIISVTNTR